jgi:hypothetical protein
MGLLVTMIQNVLLLERGAPKNKIEKKIDDCKIKGGSPLINFLWNCNWWCQQDNVMEMHLHSMHVCYNASSTFYLFTHILYNAHMLYERWRRSMDLLFHLATTQSFLFLLHVSLIGYLFVLLWWFISFCFVVCNCNGAQCF